MFFAFDSLDVTRLLTRDTFGVSHRLLRNCFQSVQLINVVWFEVDVLKCQLVSGEEVTTILLGS